MNVARTYKGKTYDQLDSERKEMADTGILKSDPLPDPKPAEYKMITAKEAKALYDESGEEVRVYLQYTVEPAVTAAATEGKCAVWIHLGATYVFERPTATPLEKAVMEELEKLGYMAKFASYGDAYVPAGLMNDDFDGPKYQNYGISIGW